jgi:hypothetical protein
MHPEIGIKTGQASNKVIFPNPYSSFRGIFGGDCRGNELEIHVGLTHEMFQGRQAFVVHFLQLWIEISIR